MREKRNLKYLCSLMDQFPLFRVDLTVLYGKELSRMGHEISWFLSSREPGGFSRRVWEGGVAYVGARLGGGAPAKLLNLLFHFLNTLRGCLHVLFGRYDFVQLRDHFFTSWPLVFCCKLRRVPLFFWLSYPFPEDWLHRAESGMSRRPWLDRLKGRAASGLLYRFLLPLSDHIFVQSEQMRRDLAARGVAPEKMTPVPMGVDATALPEDSPGDDGPVVVYTGLFFRVRRVEFVLRSFAKVLKARPEARLIMVGRGEDPAYDQELRETAQALGLGDSVQFTGFVPFDEMTAFIRRARVCLSIYHPTFILNSTSPTKLIEYMAMGKASVANEHPESGVLLGESGGGVMVAYDEREVADAVVRLLDDPAEAERMGGAARDYILRKRAYSVIAAELDWRYRDVLAGLGRLG